jgi:integrase
LIGEKAKDDEFLYPLFAIGINTGLREGDICQLRWSEIDLDGGWIARKTAKTGKSVRIPILPQIRGYLQQLSDQRSDSDFLLPAHAEMYRANRTGIGYRVSKFLEFIGIKTTKKVDGRSREVSVKDVHSLRHTFCYTAAVHGVPLTIIQSIVGHVNSQITEMYMNHASDEMKKLKLQYLPDYLGLPQAKGSILPAISKDAQLIQILKSMTPKNLTKLRQQALQILGETI